MRAKLCLALSAILVIATSASADITVSNAGSISNINPSLTPQGDYTVAPGIGNAGGFFLAGGPFIDSTINDGTESIGPDLLGGTVESSDLTTDNGGGSFNTLFTIVSTSGDLAPAGFTDGAGAPLDSLGLFFGTSGGLTTLDFSAGTVNSAFLDAFDATGASVFGGALDLIPLGFDIQSGNFGVNFGAGTAGLGIGTITLDVNVTKAIPEPTSLAILGGLGLGMVIRRRR